MTTTINGLTGVSKIQDGAVTADDLTTVTVGNAGPQRMQLFAAKATTSGTSVDFSPADGTGIPSWAKKITVVMNGVSHTGTPSLIIQLGAGSFTVSGYNSTVAYNTGGTVIRRTDGLVSSYTMAASSSLDVLVTLVFNGTNWTHQAITNDNTSTYQPSVAIGRVPDIGVIDRLRLTADGVVTFDAGSISILVEG